MITLPAELDRLLPTEGQKTILQNIEAALDDADLFDDTDEDMVLPEMLTVGPNERTCLNCAEFISETNSAVTYIHIKLPFDISEENRWFIKVWGITHSGAEIVDLTYIGKTTLAGGLVANVELDPTGGLAPTTYVGSANDIYLRFKPTNVLSTCIAVHSVTCPTGQAMSPGDITISESTSVTL